jgi:hypothetical protein
VFDVHQERQKDYESRTRNDSGVMRLSLEKIGHGRIANRHRLDPQTTERMPNWKGRPPGCADAKHHHDKHWRDRHHQDHDWWHHHCDAIVFVGGGFWGWYDGWWYPAWGYDPYYSYYDYNGPIYGYDGLQPVEIIADVHGALQQLGYYPYAVDGCLGASD